MGDQERLHQLVMNLLSNAAVHTPPGTSVVARLAPVPDAERRQSVEVSISRRRARASPTDLVPELFERFARGDSSRSRSAGSSGLGLAIVASIVDAHDGQITVASSSEGTRFTVRIAGDAADLAQGPSGTAARTEGYSPESSAMRSVMVDDLGHDEVEELLGEVGVEVRLLSQPAQPLDLTGLALEICRGKSIGSLELADALGELEPLRQQVYQRGIDVVDALADSLELSEGIFWGGGGLRHTENSTESWGPFPEPVEGSLPNGGALRQAQGTGARYSTMFRITGTLPRIAFE